MLGTSVQTIEMDALVRGTGACKIERGSDAFATPGRTWRNRTIFGGNRKLNNHRMHCVAVLPMRKVIPAATPDGIRRNNNPNKS